MITISDKEIEEKLIEFIEGFKDKIEMFPFDLSTGKLGDKPIREMVEELKVGLSNGYSLEVQFGLIEYIFGVK